MPARRDRPPVRTDRRLPPPLIDSPVFVLMQAGLIAHEWVADALEPYGLTVVQFAAMMVIQRLGPVPQVWLAVRLGRSKAAIARLASDLEAEGLVQRHPSWGDRRERPVGLTEAGRELIAEAADEVSGVEAECMKYFSEKLRKRLARLPPEELPVALSALGPVWR